MSLRPPIAAVAAAALVLAGCNALQGESRCPGESCSSELEAVVDVVDAFPGVASVEEVSSSWSLDNPEVLSVVVGADVPGPTRARALARAIAHAVASEEVGPAGPAHVVEVTLDTGSAHPMSERLDVAEAIAPARLRRLLAPVTDRWPVRLAAVSVESGGPGGAGRERTVARLSLAGAADEEERRGVGEALMAALPPVVVRGGRTIVVLHYRSADPYCYRTEISQNSTAACSALGVAG